MAVAEEQEDGDTAVRFLDGGNGMAASMYFSGGAAPAFPSGFVLNRENEDTITGTFSPYNEDAETFSLTLEYEGETQTFDGLVLNKNIFSVYQNDDSLTPGQNTRVRNYVIAVGLWTAIMLQFEEEAEVVPLNGISMSRNFIGGPQYAWWNPISAIKKAVKSIFSIGSAIASLASSLFGKAGKLLGTVAAVVGMVVSAPVVTVIATAVVITAAIIEVIVIASGGDGKNNEGDVPSDLPPEKRQAPRFRIYYRDEAGVEHNIPVMRQGETPQISQEFYIRPHDEDYTYTSNVRFYYETTILEGIDDEIKTKYVFSEKTTPYREVEPGRKDGVSYFEVKKLNGRNKNGRISLTVTVFNGSKTSPEEEGKENGNLAYFPYYYVNDEEFTGGNGFVLNFIDKPSSAEEELVLIPEHTEAESVITYSVAPDALPSVPLVNIIPANDEEWYAVS
jgi:hypothetical protein